MAGRPAVTAGIRNAALHASRSALGTSAPVADRHLCQGIRREQRRAGGAQRSPAVAALRW